MRELGRNPERRYVSDGEAATVTIAADDRGKVSGRYRARVKMRR